MGKTFAALGETHKWALRERAVYLVSHEGKTRAEAAQAVGVQRKRDRKIIHSLRLIFTTCVLISLSVRRTLHRRHFTAHLPAACAVLVHSFYLCD